MENLLRTLVNKIHTIIWWITNVVLICTNSPKQLYNYNTHGIVLQCPKCGFLQPDCSPPPICTRFHDDLSRDIYYFITEFVHQWCALWDQLHRTAWRGVGLELPALQAGFRQNSLPKHVVSKSADVWLDGSDQCSLNLSILHVINFGSERKYSTCLRKKKHTILYAWGEKKHVGVHCILPRTPGMLFGSHNSHTDQARYSAAWGHW